MFCIRSLFFSTLLMMSFNVFADSHCATHANYPLKKDTVNLNGTFYVGSDMPVGSVIYQVDIRNQEPLAIDCGEDFSGIKQMTGLENAFVDSSVLMNVAGIGSGYVYLTNITGIGVMFWVSSRGKNTSITTSASVRNGDDFNGNSGNVSMNHQIIHLSLVKTGALFSGSELLAGSLPTPYAFASETAGYSGLPLRLWDVTLTGSIKILSETCSVENVNIDLGEHEIADTFKGIDSATAWAKSSIILKGCPLFNGFHNNIHPQSINGSGTPELAATNTNTITVSLIPTSNFISEERGIFSVTNEGDNAISASGVGIQLGYTPAFNLETSSPSKIWRAGESWSLSLPKDGTQTLSIPLYARLVQTDKVVSPGTTNGKVIFTIDYK